MVYFIKNGSDNHIKIGYAKDPGKRLKELQTGSPYPLELLLTIDGDIKKEKSLHNKFKSLSVKGEWFKPEKKLLDFIGDNKSKVKSKNVLKGKFFHSFNNDGAVKWQGHIVDVDSDFAIIQLYSWADGYPTTKRVVPVYDIFNWDIYDNENDWRDKGFELSCNP